MEAKHRKETEALLAKHGYTDFKWMNPGDIVVSQWVRMKCMFGCPHYGKIGCCPPNVPSVTECRKFFDEYTTGVAIRFEKKLEKPEDRHPWTKQVNQELVKLEREIFCANHEKAFVLFVGRCDLCEDCDGVRTFCKNPKSARPSPEGMAVDVFATARKLGFPIEVLSDYTKSMNRYAFLLIE